MVVRQLLKSGAALLITRPKNEGALLALGMSKQAAVADIGRLGVADYCAGPEEDRDRAGQQCWVFGQEVAGVEVYIKLVIEVLDAKRQRLKILSYHQAERPLSYPLR